MQKIKKINLVIALIVFVVSALIAFILIKTGVGKIKISGKLSTLDLIMIGLAVLVLIICIIDIYKIKKNKKRSGEARFNVSIKINKLFDLANILLAFLSIFQLVLFVFNSEIMSLIYAIILLEFSSTNLMHSKTKNILGEKGIYHWGIYHSWGKVKSYEIDENTLKLNVEVRPLGIKSINPIKFFFEINESDNISDFLNSKINN